MKKFPLNLVNLKYFVDAVKQGSICASARTNFVSQSAISQGIAKLEATFECQLIEHQPKQFKITENGQNLFDISKDLFQALKIAEESFSVDLKKNLDFACTHSFALNLLPKILKQSKKELPHLKLKCHLGHAYSIMEWVRKGVVDFGILLDNIDISSFDCEEIHQGYYQLYVSKKCRNVDDLSFLLDSEERRETNLLKKAYKKYFGHDLPVLMEISSWEVVANMTVEGIGVGFFPDYIASARKNLLKPYPHKIISVPYKIYAIFASAQKRNNCIPEFLRLLSGLKPTKF